MDSLLKAFSNNEILIAEIEKKISLAISELQKQEQELIQKNEELKAQLLEAMEKNNVKKYENDFISLTYVAPTTKTTVDSKVLKEKHLDIYNECSKVTNVKASIRIKVKDYNFSEEKSEETPEITTILD